MLNGLDCKLPFENITFCLVLNVKNKVASTVVSQVLFVRFRTVKHVSTKEKFLCDVINNKRENKLFTSLLLSLNIYDVGDRKSTSY